MRLRRLIRHVRFAEGVQKSRGTPRGLAQAAISDRARRKSVKVGPDVSYGARTSDVLTVLASQEGERLTVADIVAVLRDRAFALLVVLLGLPNCLPMPPPIPLVCGLLLLLVAIQIAAGMSAPWLPGGCSGNRSSSRT